MKKSGTKQRRDEGRREHAALDARAHRAPGGAARARGHCERQHAQHEGERGHDDRAEALPCRSHRRVEGGHALRRVLRGELDDENRVLRRQPDQRHQPIWK